MASNLLVLGFSLIISYVIVTGIYRLYFHPLAKYPGPFWARCTVFPAWWHSKNQDRHLWLLSLQEQYGTIVADASFLGVYSGPLVLTVRQVPRSATHPMLW